MSFHLAQGLRALTRPLILVGGVWAVLDATSRAHILLDSPNGGETLDGSSTFSIDWHIDIEHDTLNWDVFYSITSDDGPWLRILEVFPIIARLV